MVLFVDCTVRSSSGVVQYGAPWGLYSMVLLWGCTVLLLRVQQLTKGTSIIVNISNLPVSPLNGRFEEFHGIPFLHSLHITLKNC